MGPSLFVFLFLNFQAVQAEDRAVARPSIAGHPSPAPSAHAPDSSARAACETEFKKDGCDEVAKKFPEEVDLLRQCDRDPSLVADSLSGMYRCFESTAESIRQAGHTALQTLPKLIIESPAAQTMAYQSRKNLFLKSCQKDATCIGRLITAATGKSPEASDVDSVKDGWFYKIDYWWNRAASKNGPFAPSQDPWFQERMRSFNGIPKDPGPSLRDQFKKLSCLNTQAQVELGCFALLAAAFPARLALVRLSESARLSKLARLAGYEGSGRVLGKAEQSLGRKLSEREAEGVLKAHYTDAGKEGVEGAAQVDNYTRAQNIRKALAQRRAGLSGDETRKLMEDGVTGLSAQEAQAAVATRQKYNSALTRLDDEMKAAINEGQSEQATIRQALTEKVFTNCEEFPLAKPCLDALKEVDQLAKYVPIREQYKIPKVTNVVKSAAPKTYDDLKNYEVAVGEKYSVTNVRNQTFTMEFTRKAAKEMYENGRISGPGKRVIDGLTGDGENFGIKLLREQGRQVVEAKYRGKAHFRLLGCIEGSHIVWKKFVFVDTTVRSYQRATDGLCP